MNSTPPETAIASPPFNPARIANYYDQVHKASWGRRAAGLFAGATLGLMFGALVGLGAAFIPALLVNMGITGVSVAAGTPWLLTPLMALKSAALYGGIGAFMGIGTATAVGESAGAVAGGLAIREHQESLANAQQPIIATQPTQDAGASGPKYYSWRPGLFFAAITGAFGAFTAAVGGSLVSANTLLVLGATTGITIAAGSAAAIIASAAVFALLGGLFGLKAGRMSVGLSNFYMKALSDDLWTSKKSTPEVTSPAPTPAPIRQSVAEHVSDTPEPAQPSRVTVPEKRSLAPEEIAAHREAERAQQTAGVTP